LEGRLAAGALRRFPGPTLFAHGTDDDFPANPHLPTCN
jgi:hypothetical protein